jgi:5-methylcytosine-specific restriction protein B
MAIVRTFFEDARSSGVHPTEVDCGWQLITHHGAPIIQLSTYGSDQRASEKKVSQTLQFDERGAAELVSILLRCFPRSGDLAPR